jgi:DNA helicase-2/ATP-dependent DNA helicase PcrA
VEKPIDLEKLNPRQREAILHTEGPLLIFAGAGSGKTRVLVHRIAHLVRNRGVQPWQIFAVTFTNKAAGEMRERVEDLLGTRADEVWLSTFHSAGVRILRRHITRLGYGPQFVIYDDTDQLTLIKDCLGELQINPKIFNPRAVQSRIDAAKNELVGPEAFSADDFFGERVAKIYELYAKKLKDNNAVDFGDLLVLPVRIFEAHPEVLAEYHRRLHYLMVDEYQDTNHAQYRLIRLLAGERKNLCVVGDDDQSIYRWRGADVRNILDFEKDFPETKVVKLEQNYRSTQNILGAASQVVKEIADRAEKTLWTENEAGEPIVYFTGNTDRDEAAFVVQSIQELGDRESMGLRQCAVFYRTNAQSRIFEDELRRRNVPYVIYGGVRFYDRMEVKDILAYLWVLANPADSLHLKRIINVPARGLGKTTVERLEAFASQHGLSLLEALSSAEAAGVTSAAAKKLKDFVELLKTLGSYRSVQGLSQLTQTVMDRTGYLQELRGQGTIEAEGRLENLEELVNVVAEYEASAAQPSLEEFLDQVALISDIDRWDENAQALPMMTLHLAKGLEFDAVFFVGMEEGLLPHVRSFDTREEMDEERRLTYVGMTRARKRLFLSNAVRRKVFGNDQYNLPSRFLDAVPAELIQRIEPPVAANWKEDEEWDDIPDLPIKSSSEPDRNNPYKIGAKVKHPIFGIGTIRNCEGDPENRKITVAFPEAGQKKLLAKFSNLTILG